MTTKAVSRSEFQYRCAKGHVRTVRGDFETPAPQRPVCQVCGRRMRICGSARMMVGEVTVHGPGSDEVLAAFRRVFGGGH